MLLAAWVLGGIGLVVAGCGSSQSGRPSLGKLEGLISAGKLSEAEDLCRKVVQALPDDPEARGCLARVLCLRGNAALVELGFFEKGQQEPATSAKFAAAQRCFESAVAEARTALRKAPRNGRIRGTLGLALYRTGQRELALEELKAALKDEPKSAEINNTLGVICYQMGKRDEALSYYQAAVALQTDLADAYLNLAIFYEEEYANFGKASSRDAAIRYYELYRRYGGGDRDAEVEKAIKNLQGKAPAGGEPAAAGGPAAGKREPK